MTDLRSRFHEADRIPAPDLWRAIVTREPLSPVRPSPWPRVAVAAAALALAALGLVLLARAFLPGLQPADQPTPTPTGTFRPQPKANGLIAFVRTDPESMIQEGGFPLSDLYTVEPDGSGALRLVGEQGFLFRTTVAWSPDGSRIAFPWPGGIRVPAGGIRVMTAGGTGIEWLTRCDIEGCHDSDPAWSPDGTKLAFTRSHSDYNLWVVDADGTYAALRRHFMIIDALVWSPDGRTIAVLGTLGPGSGDQPIPLPTVKFVDTQTGGVIRSIEPPAGLEFAGTISWSPDGQFLAFDAYGEGGVPEGSGIYVMRPDGTEVRLLTACPTDGSHLCTDIHPAWSPDGTQIAFTRALPELGSDGFMGDIFVIDVDGGRARRVTGGPGLDCCPAWQPVPAG